MEIGGVEVVGVASIAIAIYRFIKNNEKIQFVAFLGGIVILFMSFETQQYYEQDLIQFAAANNRYCMKTDSYWNCIWHWKYGPERQKNIAQAVIEKPIVTIKYVKSKPTILHETNLLSDDLDRLHQVVGINIEKARFSLGKMVGIDDITSYGFSTFSVNNVDVVQYYGNIRYDNIFPNLKDFDKSCVNSSVIRVIVIHDFVHSVTWIGDINKTCFDVFWFPNIIKAMAYQSVEELPSDDNSIYRTFRYFDDPDDRELIVTARSSSSSNNHVGIRISVIRVAGALTSSYANYQFAKSIYRDVDSISVQ